MESEIFLLCIAVAVFIFFFSLAGNKLEIIINFILRLLVGVLMIYLINTALLRGNIVSGVAINPVTMLVSGVLGVQGVVLLYALGIYFQL